MGNDLLQLGDDTFEEQRYVEATEIYMRAAEAAKSAGEIAAEAESLAQVARGLLIQGRREEGRSWLQRAIRLARPGHPSAWSRVLDVRGRFEWRASDREAAATTFDALYRYCLAHGLFIRAIDAARMAAIVEPPSEQLAWAQRAIAAAEAGDARSWLGTLWGDLACTLDALERYAEALEARLKAREHLTGSANDRDRLVAEWWVGRAYRRAGDFNEARACMLPVKAWAERRHDAAPDDDTAEWLALCCWEVGELDAQAGQRETGQLQMQQARAMMRAAGVEERWPDGMARLDRRLAALHAPAEAG